MAASPQEGTLESHVRDELDDARLPQNELGGTVGRNGVGVIGQIAATEGQIHEPHRGEAHKGVEQGVRRLTDGIRVVGIAFADIAYARAEAPHRRLG